MGMTNQEILTKAIEKAIKNGWLPFLDIKKLKWKTQDECLRVWQYDNGDDFELYTTIFSHDFAIHVWGGDKDIVCTTRPAVGHYFDKSADIPKVLFEKKPYRAWQYHLQQMVLAADPIKYLGDNI